MGDVEKLSGRTISVLDMFCNLRWAGVCKGTLVMAKGYESSAKDKADDKRKGIKEGGKKDKAMDAKAKKKLRK